MNVFMSTIIAGVILSKPDCILGLATGSSPVGTYDQLAAMYEEGILDFSHVKSVNLDEYVGLDGSNDQSYRYFMNTNLFDHVNIRKDHTFVPDGLQEAEAADLPSLPCTCRFPPPSLCRSLF